MKLRNYLLTGAVVLSFCAFAQETKPVNMSIEARGDYQRVYTDGETTKADCGFKGKNLSVKLSGNITPRLSFLYRQRINAINKDVNFFDATDFLFLNYKFNRHFSVTSGKWVVLLGGWEYDLAPIDAFQLCEFSHHFCGYQWGVSLEYSTASNADRFLIQATQSPFRKAHKEHTGKDGDLYAYSFMWYGNHGILNTCWSTNFIEYAPGKFAHYIGLGSRFKLGDHVQTDIDLTHRATPNQKYLFNDYTLIGKIDYRPIDKLKVFARASYDVNKNNDKSNYSLTAGTEMTHVGGGVEFYPLNDDRLRLHGQYSYSFGTNTNPEGGLQDKQHHINVGVTWRVKIL